MSYEKRQQIKEILTRSSPLTTLELFDKMPEKHYAFNTKTLENILSQMVSNGTVIKLKKGLYRIATEKDIQEQQSQKSLF